MSGPPGEPGAEAELARRFQRDGDPEAFRALVSPHLDAVYTVCVRMLGAAPAADDAAQETLLRALQRHRLYDPTRPIRPWLLTIAANLCRNELRRPWWRFWIPLTGAEESDRPGAETLLEGSESDAELRAALLELDPIYREAIVLFHLRDMSYEEMEQITGVAIPALKQRVRRGRLQLEKILFQRYPDSSLARSTNGE